MSPEDRRRSRWAVQPGSVSDSLSFRRPNGLDQSARERRPANEIIREVRDGAQADEPSRRGKRRPIVQQDESQAASAARPGERSRVKPDLGENRDLRAATGGSTSSLVMAGFGGVILVVVGGLLGAILDYLFTDRLGLVTTIGLALGAVVAALITRKRDLVSVIVAPPIVYAVLAAVVLLISSRSLKITSIADVAIRGFPAMALATGLAAVVAGVRLLTSRVGERR